MQVTIDIPDDLARRRDERNESWAALIDRGLRQHGLETSFLAQEVIAFLSRGPSPEEILAFRPSKESVQRASDLLAKNRDGTLSEGESAELDDMAAVNRLFTLIKAQSRQHLRAAA